MKIFASDFINNSLSVHNEKAKSTRTHSQKACDASSSLCSCSFGQAQVNMQNKSPVDIVKAIVGEKGETVHRVHGENPISCQSGKPCEGFRDLYETNSCSKCFLDENNKLKSIFILDKQQNTVEVYNSDGKQIKHYSNEDMKALKEYKYRPDILHNFLRNGKIHGSDVYQKETEEIVTKLDKMFSDESKYFKNDKEVKLYRALQTSLTQEEKDTLSTDGAVFQDKSFVSATTELNTAKRFSKHGAPIMEIILPKGSKYLDMDNLFNIDYTHWREQEYLLNRDSKFLITGFDVENNIIKAQYLSV